MIALLRAQPIKNTLSCAAALTAAVIVLSGCDQSGYSPDLRYPPRTDPLFKETGAVSGDEETYPDRPGQLPILSLASAQDPLNPMNRVLKANNLLDPLTLLNGAQRASVQENLDKMFGTPAKPRVSGAVNPGDGSDITATLNQELKLGDDVLANGSRLYRIHCLHCHGLSGDGRGPTAFWVNPHPRDYRQGIFKFTSVTTQLAAQKPRRDDLLRTIRQGIDGTSMPAFGLLTDRELDDMVSYVIHLSLRGETEYMMMKDVIGNITDRPGSALLFGLGRFWLNSQNPDNLIKPEAYPFLKSDPNTGDMVEDKEAVKAAVQRGHKFFTEGTASCASCHTDFGRKSKFRYDVWGTMVRPADLTVGTYRGGRRPIDLYNRIANGINGSGMANFAETVKGEVAKAKEEKRQAKVESLWDMVKFVEIMPYPHMRAEYGIQID